MIISFFSDLFIGGVKTANGNLYVPGRRSIWYKAVKREYNRASASQQYPVSNEPLFVFLEKVSPLLFMNSLILFLPIVGYHM